MTKDERIASLLYAIGSLESIRDDVDEPSLEYALTVLFSALEREGHPSPNR